MYENYLAEMNYRFIKLKNCYYKQEFMQNSLKNIGKTHI